jgi:hypothetical protein
MAQKCDWQSEEGRCKAWAVKGTAFCRHHPPTMSRKPEAMSLLEVVVWDALKNSRCPQKHRYQGPGKSLPCRWCRAAHAIMLVLIKMKDENLEPLEVMGELEKQVGWTLADPVVSGFREPRDVGCSVCQRRPGEPYTSWCKGCNR